MQRSNGASYRAGEAGRPFGDGHLAEVISLDEWRRKRRPQASMKARLEIVEPAPARRARIPVDALLFALILASAIGGAMLALMYVGRIP